LPLDVVEKIFLNRLFKNVQIQGARCL